MQILKLLLTLGIVFLAFSFRLPFWATWRLLSVWTIAVGGIGLIIWSAIDLKKTSASNRKFSSLLILAIASFALAYASALQIKFYAIKYNVLNADSQRLEKFGQHFIVGYRNSEEIKTLISKKAIGGVFITTRNVKNKTKQEIDREIQSWQDIRQQQGLPPLWIAADQEGGAVSRLSPPLTKLPALSTIVGSQKNLEQKKAEVIKYATIQAKELSEIGVNLNFAPVVDINKGIIDPNDKYSRIYQRAISTDKEVVAKVALWYCQTLEKYGVRCTLKHFPGLGRVNTDTHIADAELNVSIEELNRDDWIPFREVTSKSKAVIMLSHAKVTALDPRHPVSFSQQVVTEIIRKNWQYNGILITDDFSMQAVYGSEDGLETATIKAINAGVDLILFAYDKDLYYEAMFSLLRG